MNRIGAAVLLTLFVGSGVAFAGGTDAQKMILSLDRIMVQLGAESARDSKAIKDAYRTHLDLLVLDEYSSVERALYTGGLAPLPGDPKRFNLSPRVSGQFPIGEKDLVNQTSYIAARPATIGALLTVASRITSGPIEITSLVRHSEYQGALRKTNANATTAVPMHTMGLAFDIAVVNTPLARAYEIRNVLREMRDAGEILFIGERQQLVFHVVPHPSRLGYFTDVYTRALGSPPGAKGTLIVGFSPSPIPSRPAVSAEVISVVPVSSLAEEWWAADAVHGDLIVDVTPSLANPAVVPVATSSPLRRPHIAPFVIIGLGAALVFSYRRSRDQEYFSAGALRSATGD